MVCRGVTWQAGRGLERLGQAWRELAWQAWPVTVRPGKVGRGKACRGLAGVARRDVLG